MGSGSSAKKKYKENELETPPESPTGGEVIEAAPQHRTEESKAVTTDDEERHKRSPRKHSEELETDEDMEKIRARKRSEHRRRVSNAEQKVRVSERKRSREKEGKPTDDGQMTSPPPLEANDGAREAAAPELLAIADGTESEPLAGPPEDARAGLDPADGEDPFAGDFLAQVAAGHHNEGSDTPTTRRDNGETLRGGASMSTHVGSKTLQHSGMSILEDARRTPTMGRSKSSTMEPGAEDTRTSPTMARSTTSTKEPGMGQSRTSTMELGLGNSRMTTKSALPPESPRTQRRASIREHRLAALEEAPPEFKSGYGSPSNRSPSSRSTTSPKSPSRKRQHRDRPGSALCAESYILMKTKKKEVKHVDVEQDPLCGFKVGDKVKPDAEDSTGPWKGLGEATVLEPGNVEGFLVCKFVKNGDSFSIKAHNLRNLTDPSRSGAHFFETQEAKMRSVSKMRAALREQSGAGFVEQNDSMRGMRPGDTVAIGQGGTGIVVQQDGSRSDYVLVRFGDLGIRSFPAKDLTVKTATITTNRELEIQRARSVDGGSKFALSMDQAIGTFNEKHAFAEGRVAKEEAQAELEEQIEETKEDDPLMGLRTGDYVVVQDERNPAWRDLGMACLRGPGDVAGTMYVQFDSGGECWCLDVQYLKKVPAPDRRFRVPGSRAIPQAQKAAERIAEAEKKKEEEEAAKAAEVAQASEPE